MQFVLLYAALEFPTFRQAEFKALLEITELEYDKDEVKNHIWSDNFLVLTLKSEDDCMKLIKRSMLIKCAYIIWVKEKSFEKLYDSISKLDITIDSSKTFRLNFESLYRRFDSKIKIDIIDKTLSSHNAMENCKLNLENPDFEIGLVIDYFYDLTKGCVANENPIWIYYGKLLGYSDRLGLREKYNLSKRKFIGNTSMDVNLSFIMSNLGRVKKHDLVLDPFVGTGSILVAAGHLNAKVIGCDIDYKVIHGMGKSTRANEVWREANECLRTNFIEYGMLDNFIDVFVGDSSRLHKILRSDLKFDCILTDPPYGVRERSRKIKSKELQPNMYENHVNHFPQKENYDMDRVFGDLLELAARRLVLNGYIVMWLPVIREEYHNEHPQHSCLQLISACEQILSKKTSRILLTYKKIQEFQEISQLTTTGLSLCKPSSFREYFMNQ